MSASLDFRGGTGTGSYRKKEFFLSRDEAKLKKQFVILLLSQLYFNEHTEQLSDLFVL